MRPSTARRLALLALATLAGVTCTDAPTAPRSPGGAGSGMARLALAPAFTREAVQAYDALEAFGLAITNVRVVLRHPAGGVALDTVVQVAPGQDGISLQFSVPVQGGRTPFDAVVQLRDGDRVLFEGTQRVFAEVGPGRGGNAPPPPEIAIDYVGPGAAARSLRILPRDTTIATGAAIAFAAQALDSAGQPVPDAVVLWSLADSSLGGVGNRNGAFQAGSRRGTVRVLAQLPSSVHDEARVHIVPPASEVVLVSGADQSGTVGRPLAAPVVIEARAADGLPAAGERVVFTASTGATVTGDSAITDSLGRAATTLTLGRAPGRYTLTARVGQLTPLAVSATAITGAPAHLAVHRGAGQSGQAGQAAAQPLSVLVTDDFDNPVAGAVVAWAVTAGSGQLAAPADTTGSDGTSAVAYTFGTSAGAESVAATVTTAAGPATAAFALTATAGQPATIQVVAGAGQVATAGAPLSPFVVRVLDAFGNPVPGASVTWTVSAGNASLPETRSVTSDAGEASVIATAGRTAGALSVVAAIDTPAGSAPAPSVTFEATVGPGAPAALTIVSGSGQSVAAGEDVAPFVVRVDDALGNAVAGVAVTWRIVQGGGRLQPAGDSTAPDGTASSTLAPDSAAGPVRVRAVAASDSADFSVTIRPGPPAHIEPTAGDAQVAPQGSRLPVAPQVRVTDAHGNPTAGVVVTFSVGSGGGSVSDSIATSDAAGIAGVGGWTLGSAAGPNTLVAAAGELRTTFSATARAGDPARLVVVGDSALQLTAGSTLPPAGSAGTGTAPQLRVTDAAGNPVAGVALDVALEGPGLDAPSVTSAVSDSSGLAPLLAPDFAPVRAGRWQATASTTRIPGAALRVGVQVVHAAADSIARIAGDAQAGTPGHAVAVAPAVRVSDRFGNPVPGALVTFAVTAGGGAVTGEAATTDSAGIATVGSWILGAGGAQSLAATAGALVANFAATLPLPVTRLAVVHDRAVGHPGEHLLLAVRAENDLGEGVAGVAVEWSAVQGAFAFDSASGTSTTDGDGIARMTIAPQLPDTDVATVSRDGGSRHEVRAAVATNAALYADLRGLVLPVGFTKGWFGGRAGHEDDWDDADNWNGGGPPGLADRTFIPGWQHAPRPRLGGGRGVAALVMEGNPAAGLDLGGHSLEVHGMLMAQGAGISGASSSLVRLTGGAATLRGTLAVPTVRVERDATLDGATTFGGAVVVDSGGRLRVGRMQADVAGDLSIVGGSFLEMKDPAGLVHVHGNVLAAGGDHAQSLTAGTLQLDGNLTESGDEPQAFQANNDHLVRLTGDGMQVVSLQHGGYSHLSHLQVAKGAGSVQFTGDQYFTGSVAVTSATPVLLAAEASFEVQGELSTVAGSDLSSVGNLRLVGDGPFPAIAGTPPRRLSLAAARTLEGDAALATTLAVDSAGTLRLGPHTLVLDGDLALWNGGLLESTDAASRVRVNGNLYAGGGSEAGKLSAGTLELTGNLTESGGAADAFQPSGSHTVRLVGDGKQVVSFEHPGSSRFQDLEVANAGDSVTFSGAQHVQGLMAVRAGATVVQAGDTTFEISGGLSTEAGSDLSGVPNVTTRGAFATFPAIKGAGPATLTIGSDVTLESDATFRGPITLVDGGRLRLAGRTLVDSGSFTIRGDAFLQMVDSTSRLAVTGDFTASGGNHADSLTAGTLEIGGSFTEADGAEAAFQASGTHLTRFTGTALRTVSFAHDQASWFNALEIEGGADATFVSDARVKTLTNRGKFAVSPGKTLTVEGDLDLQPGSVANAGANSGKGNVTVGSGRCKQNGGTVVGTIPNCAAPPR